MSVDRDRNERTMLGTRPFINILMGVFYICMGIYMMKIPSLPARFGADAVYIFLGLFCTYGLYRLVRGVFALMRRGKD